MEVCLSMLEFRDKAGLNKVSPRLVFEALTTPAARSKTSYERLEFLGDSVLKFGTTFSSFMQHNSYSEGVLAISRSSTVSNRNLFEIGRSIGIGSVMLNEKISTKEWVPPGFENSDYYKPSQMSLKTIADSVEALIGACFQCAGIDTALDFLERVGLIYAIPKSKALPSVWMGADTEQLSERREKLEEKLNYSFCRTDYVNLVLDYKNLDAFGKVTLQRLEFLGDAVLDLNIACHLFKSYPDLGPGSYTNQRSEIVNNRELGSIAAPFVDDIQDFPKLAGDLFETLLAGIFLDCGCDLDKTFLVLKPLLLDRREETRLLVKHPVRQLQELTQTPEHRNKPLKYM
jgi:dsRNA-specific ribonuclease